MRVRSVFEPFQLGNSSRLPATVQPFHLHHGTYRCNRALYDRVHGYARALDREKCAWFRLVSVYLFHPSRHDNVYLVCVLHLDVVVGSVVPMVGSAAKCL